MPKTNYYVNQIDKALKDHDHEHPLQIKISGTKGSSNYMTLPIELARYIKQWYQLNGDIIN